MTGLAGRDRRHGRIAKSLIFVSIMVVANFLSGCQGKKPEITLNGYLINDLPELTSDYGLTSGEFLADQSDYRNLCGQIRLYIDNYLSERGLNNNEHRYLQEEGATFPVLDKLVISGHFGVTKTSITGSENGGMILVVETTYQVNEEDNETIVFGRSQRSEIGVGPNSDANGLILNELKKQADYFIELLRPIYAKKDIQVTMKIGDTKYDKQGRDFASHGDWAKALICFRKAIDVAPDDDASLYNLGLTYEVLGDYEKAGIYYLRAATLVDIDDYNDACKRIQERLAADKQKDN